MDAGTDFEAFFAASYDRVVRTLTLVLGDRERAEDAAVEAFAKAHRRWRAVRDVENRIGWVYVVALRDGRRHLRRALREEPVSSHDADVTPDAASAVAISVSVRASLQQLAPRQRAAVVLRYLADLSLEQVADAMGCSVGTAKATLHAALKRLRVSFEDEDVEP